jgi:hypothetical protein
VLSRVGWTPAHTPPSSTSHAHTFSPHCIKRTPTPRPHITQTEPYKGKGIRYAGEVIKLKEGKGGGKKK